MNTFKISIRKNKVFYGFLFGIILSAIFLILSFFLPYILSSNYLQKSSVQLRNQKNAINNEFAKLIDEINRKQKLFSDSPFPEKKNEIFNLFKKLHLDKEKEGIGYYSNEGDLILWMGNVFDLKRILFTEEIKTDSLRLKTSFLVRHKSSSYLVSCLKVKSDEYIIFYRLLAFIPEFKASYIKEYHFLKTDLLRNCIIYYWDFREDVTGFERIFSKHNDEYTGQPRSQEKIHSMFFPLRNEENKIVATLTLNSPPIPAKLSSQKENLLLVFFLLLGTSLLFLLIHLVKSPSFYKRRKPLPGLLIILTLIGLRFIFFPVSNLEKIRSLPFFSPSLASFFSIWDFTKSPADIFLTSFFLFLIIGCLAFYSQNLFKYKKKKIPLLLSLTGSSSFIFTSLFFIFVFKEILWRLVTHSNINLLHFSFKFSFFLLHFSILLLFFVFFFVIFIGLKVVSLYSTRLLSPLFILFVELGAYFFLFKGKNFPLFFLLQVLVILLIFTIAFFPKVIKRKEVLFSAFLLGTLFIYSSLHYSSSSRNRSLIENSLQNIINSQEPWGIFLLNQSLPEIDKKRESIVSFLKSSEPYDLAHGLWRRTLIAKFNWYSSLEILNPEGVILSRFSLNVPQHYRLDFDLPLSKDWSRSRLNIPFMGEEKDFLLGYKDWFEEGNHLGRTILFLSIDYDMLPFLYSANPYFELLRVTSIPSLNQLDFGFAIFDLDGRLLFTPDKISSGIPLSLLKKINTSQDSFWASFTDKKKKFQSFYFRKSNRIYSLFIPKKKFL